MSEGQFFWTEQNVVIYEINTVMEGSRFTPVGKQDLKQIALKWSFLPSLSPDHFSVSFFSIILLQFLH